MNKRIVKKPEVRRKDILSAADMLFAEKGYQQTSVESIITAVGIAKGTFYYYFKSKRAVLEALVEHLGAQIKEHFEEILNTVELSAVEKLKQMLTGPKKRAIANSPVMNIIHQVENRELQAELNRHSIEHLAPLIAAVLEQGNQAAIFKVEDPLETTQLLLASSLFILDSGLFDWDQAKTEKLLLTAQRLFEQALGIAEGSLGFNLGQ